VIRLGVIGAGLVAQVAHLPSLAELADRFTVAALAEPDSTTRHQVARRHGIAVAVHDHRELLEQGRLDAVLICSPNHTHAEIALDALDAGLHVLVEKPLCLTVAEADAIAAARDRAGRVVQVGYMKRFDPAYEAMLDALAHDMPEPLHLATLTYDPGLAAEFGPARAPAPIDVRSDVFLGALVHDLNAARGILARLGIDPDGRVIDAFARPDGAAAGGTLAFGPVRCTLAWLRVDGLHDFRERIELFGTTAVHALEFPAPYLRHAPTRYRRSTGSDGANSTHTFRSWREAYARQLEHFHDCIALGAPCRTPPEQARDDIACLSAMHDVAAAGAIA
jgi:predicted dehydrogenase